MKVNAFILLIVLVGQTARSQSAAGVHVEGTVADAITGRPLSGVTVQIAGLKAVSNVEGSFAFEKVPAGRHLLLADKEGYLRVRPEGWKLADDGIPVSVSAEKSVMLNLRMLRGGVVSGRILDGQGTPVKNAVVIPYRSIYGNDGHLVLKRITLNRTDSTVATREAYLAPTLGRSLGIQGAELKYDWYDYKSKVASGRTNDLGEFRIFNLVPGRYSFYAIPPYINNSQLKSVELNDSFISPFFYPGVANLADAETVEVESGSDIRLKNMSLLSNGNVATLKVHLIDRMGMSQQDRPVIQVRRKGSAEPIIQENQVTFSAEYCAANPSSCHILRLPVGSYDVEVIISGVDGNISATSIPVEMRGSDVDLDISVSLGARINAFAEFQREGSQSTPVGGVRINLRSESITPNIVYPITSAANGVFKANRIPYSTYRVENVSGIPSGMCLDEIRQPNRNVIRDGLKVSGEEVTFSAIFSESQAFLRGKVTDTKGKSVAGAMVVLVPDESANTEAFASNTTDQEGAFELSCLRAGKYHLFAWLELEGTAYRNAEFMKKFDKLGIPIEIKLGTKASIDLKVLGER